MKEGDLRVWWIPQVPMKAFHVSVRSVEEGVLVMDTLAKYDIFQFENNIKPDYCNAGGLQICEPGETGELEWTDWYDPDTGNDNPEEWVKTKRQADALADTMEQNRFACTCHAKPCENCPEYIQSGDCGYMTMGQNHTETPVDGDIILGELLTNVPMHIAELTRRVHMPMTAVSSLLVQLELKGLVTRHPGDHYSKNETGGGGRV